MISYFTSLLYFSYIILFLYHSPPGYLKHSVIHPDLKNHNVFSKKTHLCNIACLRYNYLWMITSNNWLKRIVNVPYLKICSNFIFTASCHRTCFFFSILNIHTVIDICIDVPGKKTITDKEVKKRVKKCMHFVALLNAGFQLQS